MTGQTFTLLSFPKFRRSFKPLSMLKLCLGLLVDTCNIKSFIWADVLVSL